jgi:hypothetical protein
VLGCDGINSAVRDQLARTISFDFARSYIDSLYVELSMPAKLDAAGQLDFALDPHHLHIWPRHDYMLIALPNPDHTFTCTLFAPAGIFEEHLSGREKTLAFFEDKFPDALPLMGRDAVARDIAERRPSPLASVRCRPYHYKGRVLLLGDSSHAMLPFYGQGLNCGFEDVRVLLELIDRHAEEEEMPRPTAPAPTSRTHSRSDSGVSMSSRAPSPRALKPHAVSGAHPSTQALERALAEYSATRHDDLVAICDLAQNNYYEMCSRGESCPLAHRSAPLLIGLPISRLAHLSPAQALRHAPHARPARRLVEQSLRDGHVLQPRLCGCHASRGTTAQDRQQCCHCLRRGARGCCWRWPRSRKSFLGSACLRGARRSCIASSLVSRPDPLRAASPLASMTPKRLPPP